MNTLVGSFNQEKALVGEFSVIVNTSPMDCSSYLNIHIVSITRFATIIYKGKKTLLNLPWQMNLNSPMLRG